jgi:hypothetical protein
VGTRRPRPRFPVHVAFARAYHLDDESTAS